MQLDVQGFEQNLAVELQGLGLRAHDPRLPQNVDDRVVDRRGVGRAAPGALRRRAELVLGLKLLVDLTSIDDNPARRRRRIWEQSIIAK